MRRAAGLPDFDPYAELGVEPWAAPDAIDRAWRERIQAAHPDRAGADEHREATARSARLNEARSLLLDAERRARYDEVRWPRHPRPAPAIDPLGAWPPRRRPPRPPASLAPAIALLATMGLLAALVMGPGPGNLTASALALLCLLLLAFYSFWSVLAVIRRR